VLLVLAVAACAPIEQLPPRTAVPVEVRPSPNFDERRPNFVILHHTSNDNADEALATLTDPARKVSSHYLIGRDGKIYYLVDELARAWHAGESYWGGGSDLNSASIGIELDNNGEEPFAEVQIEALLALLIDLKARYAIPAANFLGHSDVAPGRKVDPSRWFPWQRLAASGFGLWCEPPVSPVAAELDNATLLAAFGYDVSDPAAAVAAFKRHFAPDDASPDMTDESRALLNCLVSQKQDG
jgi:N-acetylmuramoyl-L-alanine amidase